jgi:hypothetical protein
MAAEPPAKDSKQSIVVLLLALALLPLVLPLKYILLALAFVVAAFILLPRRTSEAAATAAPQSAEQQQPASRATEQLTFDSPAAGPAPAQVTLSAADGIAREDTRPPPAESNVSAEKAAPLPPPDGKSGPVVGGAAILARLRCTSTEVDPRFSPES